MRRIAPLLADLFVRHGLAVEADAALVGQRGTGVEYVVPLAVRSRDAVLAIDGDFSGCPVDNVTLATFKEACYDTGASGLFVHSGPLSTAAARSVGDRIRLWSVDALVQFIGQSELNAALGLPLPAIPEFQAWPVTGAAALQNAIPAAPLADSPAPEPVQDLEIDLPASAAAEVHELTEQESAAAVSEPFIELAEVDETPVLHLEEADVATVAVEPAPPTATEAPDVIPLSAITAPEPVITDVLAEPEFEVPTVNELLPPAFRAAPVVEEAAAEEPLFSLPPVFAAPEGDLLRAPEGSQGLLPPRVTLDEAKQQVADRLFSIEEAELILQPVHLFDYTVALLRPGSLKSNDEVGRIQVNGTDRRVTPTVAAKCDPGLPHRVFADEGLTVMDKVLRVSPERAEQLANLWATAEHAKTVSVTTNRADDSFELVEKKSIAPTSGQVTLTPLGLWHRPFWRLWGSNGHVDIDAVEGHVLDEEIKTPNPDFLVVE
ncbi:MAG: hypothetical protein AABY18_03130 [Candidatus Thermoplasmatota archaeon]